MITLLHTIGEKGVRTRDQALERFFSYLEEHNGNRRKSPREFVEVVSIRKDKERGTWRIHYRIPRRYRATEG